MYAVEVKGFLPIPTLGEIEDWANQNGLIEKVWNKDKTHIWFIFPSRGNAAGFCLKYLASDDILRNGMEWNIRSRMTVT